MYLIHKERFSFEWLYIVRGYIDRHSEGSNTIT